MARIESLRAYRLATQAGRPLLRHRRDAVDLDEHVGVRERRADRRAGRRLRGEELAIHGVHLLEVADVFQIDAAAGDLRVVGAGGPQDRADLLEDRAGLRLDALLLAGGLS